ASDHHIQLGWRVIGLTRDGDVRTCLLARPHSLARTGIGKNKSFSLSTDHKEHWQRYPGDSDSAERDDCDHTESTIHIPHTQSELFDGLRVYFTMIQRISLSFVSRQYTINRLIN
ncbi:unnamed protein product, partial [Ascophyllum nodosum]